MLPWWHHRADTLICSAFCAGDISKLIIIKMSVFFPRSEIFFISRKQIYYITLCWDTFHVTAFSRYSDVSAWYACYGPCNMPCKFSLRIRESVSSGNQTCGRAGTSAPCIIYYIIRWLYSDAVVVTAKTKPGFTTNCPSSGASTGQAHKYRKTMAIHGKMAPSEYTFRPCLQGLDLMWIPCISSMIMGFLWPASHTMENSAASSTNPRR